MTTERPQQQDDGDHIGHIIERTLPVKPKPEGGQTAPPETEAERIAREHHGWPFPTKEG